MNAPEKFDSTDIAQLCRDGDGRFDDLRNGGMVKEDRRPKRSDWKAAAIVVLSVFAIVLAVSAVVAVIAG